MKQKTTFDKVGYAIIAVAWAAGIIYGLSQGAFAMGEMIAYLAFGSGAFMCLWMLVGWMIRKFRPAARA
jgi:putative Mn2+ efflux pump MntP